MNERVPGKSSLITNKYYVEGDMKKFIAIIAMVLGVSGCASTKDLAKTLRRTIARLELQTLSSSIWTQ